MRDDSPMEGDLGADALGDMTVGEAAFDWEGEDWHVELAVTMDPIEGSSTVRSWMAALARFHPYVHTRDREVCFSMCVFALEPEQAVEMVKHLFATTSHLELTGRLEPTVHVLEERRGAWGHTVRVS